jgi:endoglucanase
MRPDLKEGATVLNELVKLVSRLSSTPGVSGFEDPIIDLVRQELEPHVDSVSVDALGNVIGVKKGASESAPRIMVDAHIDQPAMTVKYIEPSGFVRMERQGYPNLAAMPAQRVSIHTSGRGTVKGVIGVKGIHFYFSEVGGAAPPAMPNLRDLYIDVGCDSKEAVLETGISVGDPITYQSDLDVIGPGKLIIGQAFDNRALVAVMIDAMKRLSSLVRQDATIYAVGSTMEEIGVRGARAALHRIKPDMFIGLDITVCADTPDSELRDFPTRVGRGPVITIADMVWTVALLGMTAHPAIRDHFIQTAMRERIPHQVETITGAVSNSSAAHETGVPAGTLKVATRYSHTASEVLSVEDLENCSRLLAASLRGIGPDFSLARPWKPASGPL